LIRGGGERPFSDEELVNQLMGFLLAGHETTANFLGKAIYLLLNERSRWLELVENPSLIPQAVEELLRFDSSVTSFPRTATQDTELAGKSIAAGDGVLVVYSSANHDQQFFPEPDRLDLHRRSAHPHMAFGHGIHYCIGAPLARLASCRFSRVMSRLVAPGDGLPRWLSLWLARTPTSKAGAHRR
jgi:cytochrome P450